MLLCYFLTVLHTLDAGHQSFTSRVFLPTYCVSFIHTNGFFIERIHTVFCLLLLKVVVFHGGATCVWHQSETSSCLAPLQLKARLWLKWIKVSREQWKNRNARWIQRGNTAFTIWPLYNLVPPFQKYACERKLFWFAWAINLRLRISAVKSNRTCIFRHAWVQEIQPRCAEQDWKHFSV